MHIGIKQFSIDRDNGFQNTFGLNTTQLKKNELTKNIQFCSGITVNTDASIELVDGDSIVVGDNCVLRHGCLLLPDGGSITLENNVAVRAYNVLNGHGGLCVDKHTLIGPHVGIIPANHKLDRLDIPIGLQGESRRRCWLLNKHFV